MVHGKKTYTLTAMGVLALLVPVFTGEIAFSQFISSDEVAKLFIALTPATIRHAIAKALSQK